MYPNGTLDISVRYIAVCHMDCGIPQRVDPHWNVRKPQRGRKATAPLHTPRAFFENFLVVGMCDRVGLFLCSSVLDVGRCADMGVSASIVVGVTLSTFVCMLRCWMWNAVPIVAV